MPDGEAFGVTLIPHPLKSVKCTRSTDDSYMAAVAADTSKFSAWRPALAVAPASS